MFGLVFKCLEIKPETHDRDRGTLGKDFGRAGINTVIGKTT